MLKPRRILQAPGCTFEVVGGILLYGLYVSLELGVYLFIYLFIYHYFFVCKSSMNWKFIFLIICYFQDGSIGLRSGLRELTTARARFRSAAIVSYLSAVVSTT